MGGRLLEDHSQGRQEEDCLGWWEERGGFGIKMVRELSGVAAFLGPRAWSGAILGRQKCVSALPMGFPEGMVKTSCLEYLPLGDRIKEISRNLNFGERLLAHCVF